MNPDEVREYRRLRDGDITAMAASAVDLARRISVTPQGELAEQQQTELLTTQVEMLSLLVESQVRLAGTFEQVNASLARIADALEVGQ